MIFRGKARRHRQSHLIGPDQWRPGDRIRFHEDRFAVVRKSTLMILEVDVESRMVRYMDTHWNRQEVEDFDYLALCVHHGRAQHILPRSRG